MGFRTSRQQAALNRADGPNHFASNPLRNSPIAPRRSISTVEFVGRLGRNCRQLLRARVLPVAMMMAAVDPEVVSA